MKASALGLLTSSSFALSVLGVFWITPVSAQVNSAKDQIGTDVLTNGDRFTIQGGATSSNGANLFHSFDQFSLDAQQAAIFQSNPEIQNILGRVIGGHSSMVDGLIQVSGSDANLFLLNPAGILFGPNARLDVLGDFTATTATGIGFGDGKWFSSIGVQSAGADDISAFVDNPNLFVFGNTNPSAIANLGDLSVEQGQRLTLLGGSVLNTGTLSAPGGTITIAAIEGENLVQIRQEGMALGLEMETLEPASELRVDAFGSGGAIAPVDLPTLLTGGTVDTASDVTMAADGSLRLIGSTEAIATAPASITVAGIANASGATGGNITVLGEQVAVTDAQFNASGQTDGGTVHIGGERGGQGHTPTALTTWIGPTTNIIADAQDHGNGGEVVVWADGTTRFDGVISAQGGTVSGDGGFVEVSGADTLLFRGSVNTLATNGNLGTLLLDPENIIIADGSGANDDTQLGDSQILAGDGGTDTFTISEATLEGLDGNTNVVMEASNNITVNNLTDDTLEFATGSGSIQFTAGGSFTMLDAADVIQAPQRVLTINAGTISVGSIDVRAQGVGGIDGAIALTANEFQFMGGADSVRGDSIHIEPKAVDQDINLGSSTDMPDALDLTITDIEALSDGFSSITIGRSDGTGTVTVFDAVTDSGVVPFQDPVAIAGGLTLVGPNQDTTWNITATDQGNLDSLFANGFSFDTIENLTGGADDDTFVFANGVNVTGSVDGGTGTDTLDYSAYTSNLNVDLDSLSDVEQVMAGSGSNTLRGDDVNNDWQVTGVNSGTINGGAFNNFQNLVGGSLTDTFTITTTGSVSSINGGAGNNTLVGPDTATSWNLIGTNSGIVTGGGIFSNIQNVVGGSGNDTFTVIDNAAITGTLDAGLGTDHVNYSAYISSPISYSLDGAVTGAAGVSNVELVTGSSGTNDLVTGSSSDDLFAVTGFNNFTVGSVDFSGFENIAGADGNDDVLFTANGVGLAGTIDGGTGTNSLDYTGYTANITVDLGINTATGITGGFSNINAIAGGSGANDTVVGTAANDSFTFAATNTGTVTGIRVSAIETLSGMDGDDSFIFDGGSISNLDGGTGTDSVIGDDTANSWAIASANAGTLNGTNFSDVEAITGGTAADTFVLADGITFGGSLDGNLGTDTLDYSAFTTDPAVNMASLGAASIENIVGSASASTSTLQGDNIANRWELAGTDAGTLNGSIIFSNFDTFIGGTANDDFVFANGAGIRGAIDGGSGTNRLDYSGYTSAITVDLTTSTILGIPGGFNNISAIAGSSNINDTILGTVTDDTFTFTATNTGTVAGIDFSAIEQVNGTDGNDTFIFDGGSISNIEGWLGTDRIVGNDGANTWAITASNIGTLNGNTFNNIENLIGGSDADTFQLNGGSISGSIDGGLGSDTVRGTTGDDTVAIATNHEITVNGNSFTNIDAFDGHTGIDTLQGTTGDDNLVIDGDNAATIAGIGSTNIEAFDGGTGTNTIQGTAGDDTLVITGTNAAIVANIQATNLDAFDGDAGTDTIQGSNANETFTITGADEVTIQDIDVLTVESLRGQGGNDTFAFADGVVFGGTVDGGSNTDTLDFSGYTVDPNVDLSALGATNIETVSGSTLALTSTLRGTNTVNTWNISGADAGDINGTTFSNFSTLVGGSNADTFQVNGGSLRGSLDGLGGDDNLAADNSVNSFTLTGPDSGIATGIAGTFSNIENLTGGNDTDTFQLSGGTISGNVDGAGGSDILIGDNAANTFSITGADSGSVTGVAGTFSDIENLTGGADTDSFNLSGGTISGNLDGMGGNDTLVGDNVVNTFSITGADSGNATGVTGTFSNIENLTGGTNTDTFQLSGGALSGNLDGTGGADTLIGDNVANTFSVTGTDSGSVTGLAGSFSNIENLSGGNSNDTFQLAGGSITGVVDGLAGIDNLQATAGDDTFSVTGVNTVTIGDKTFANIEIVDGQGGTDSVVATAGADTFTLTGTRAITLSAIDFSDVETLDGGAGDDAFEFNGNVNFDGTVIGGDGTDRLDYSRVTSDITLTIDTLMATGIGGFSDIETIVGGSGTNDTVNATSGSDAVNLTGANTGNVAGFNFSAFENVGGLAGDDTITFTDESAQVSGVIDGDDGTLTLVGDEINLGNGVMGTGALYIQPDTPQQDIQIGGIENGEPSILELSASEVASLQDGFINIIVGQADGSGAVTVASDIMIADPLLIQSPIGTGSIDTQDFSLTGTDNASLELIAAQAITTGAMTTDGQAITASGNIITTGDIDTQNQIGDGGAIALSSTTSISTGHLTTSGIDHGGDIRLEATSTIDVGAIATQSSMGQAGSVSLHSAGAIQLQSINAEGDIGGTIDITTDNVFRTTDSFIATNGQLASLSSIGSGVGDITIRHGGNGIIPFEIGAGNVNGSVAAITSGDFEFAPSESFPNSVTRGNIRILTQDRIAQPSDSPTPSPIIVESTPEIETAPITPMTQIIPTTPTISSSITDVTDDLTPPSEPISTPPNSSAPPDATLPNNKPVMSDISIDFAEQAGVELPIDIDNLQIVEDHLTADESSPLAIEIAFTRDFQDYLDIPNEKEIELATVAETRQALREVELATDLKPALIYVYFVPSLSGPRQTLSSSASDQLSSERSQILPDASGRYQRHQFPVLRVDDELRDRGQDSLEIVLVSGEKTPIRYHFGNITRSDVEAMVHELQNQATSLYSSPQEYLPPAQQLYDWIIAPLKADIDDLGLDGLTFIMDDGLRSAPISALHSGERFLIEEYSVSLMPSFSLVDVGYVGVHDMEVLAMGASEFESQGPLPAVPQEISAISQTLWQGNAFLNQDFTLEKLLEERSHTPYGIVHMATHANFVEGEPDNSYIQLWDQRIGLNQMGQMRLHDPAVELLVLSACNTALGNEEAELGFAGLSVQAGVASSLASLWYVSDDGTLAFMREFYQQLRNNDTKVHALRQAQLAMLSGDVWVDSDNLVYSDGTTLPLPPEFHGAGSWSLDHPLYWSAFTLIGSPW
ncbi:MAG: CHAT domain-containing protein [Cyanobacteria bacterium P01_F01_bin.150]